MRYEYMPVRKVTRQGITQFKAMFRIPEQEESSLELQDSKSWRGVRHPVHEKYIELAERREEEEKLERG